MMFGRRLPLSLLELAMSLSDEMQDENTKNGASTQDPQAEFIGTFTTNDRSTLLPSNEEVRPSTDRRVAEQVCMSSIHPP
jgi:hypothetical protein